MKRLMTICIPLSGLAALWVVCLAGCSETHLLNDSPTAAAGGDADNPVPSSSDLDADADGDVDGDADGDLICHPSGAPCAVAADCCSLGCDGAFCVDSLCFTDGETCGNNAECCSNRCIDGACETTGGCLPVGEDCGLGGSAGCCSLNCTLAEDDRMRCSGIGACRSEGEVCSEPADCCTYQCESGYCRVDPDCNTSGLVCESDEDCCSGKCNNDGSGFQTCTPLGGCTPTGDLCFTDDVCCSDAAHDGSGACEAANVIGNCGQPLGCAPAGELCGPLYQACCPCLAPADTATCPNASGAAFCRQTTEGVARCFSDNCVLGGGDCDADGDCCSGDCNGVSCEDGFECREDGAPCAMPDQCCCGKCEQDGFFTGEFVCCPEDEQGDRQNPAPPALPFE
jgi:hypothetical protein